MIKFYIDRGYVRELYRTTVTGPFDLYTKCLHEFAKEHNCTIDETAGFQYHCAEEDFLILKLIHPGAIVHSTYIS